MSEWNKFRKAYKKKHGVTTIKQISNAYKQHKKSPKKVHLSTIKKHIPKTRRAKIRQLKGLKKGGRGAKTRTWAAQSPQPGRERHELKRKCGNKAFLLPEQEKFPVMPALRYTGGKCQYSCEGIEAAFRRAKQYHYNDVAAKADKLGKRICHFSPHKHHVKSPPKAF